ncbi:MAG: hypothetical protein Kow00114_29390 [Kiloniellaceae bacterium]
MVNRPEEFKSSESVESVESPESAENAARGGEALAWAIRFFGFEPGQRRSQPGVESLQRWLREQGAPVVADGILGPSTLSALDKLYVPGLQVPDGESAVAARMSEKSFAKRAAAPRARKRGDSGDAPDDATGKQRKARAEPPPDPATPPGTSPGSPPHASDSDASARPVALSDSAIDDPAGDRLNFAPYVKAVADFILAEQTRPPLAIAINAPWGHGKTSFMKLLDARLKADAPGPAVRVATTWFNPWKYNEPEQVWAAFVATVTRCLRERLTPGQTARFLLRRFGTKLYRHRWDVSLWLRVLVAAIFLSLIGCLVFLDLAALRDAVLTQQGLLEVYEKIPADERASALWTVAAWLSIALAVLVAYVGVANKLGLNLLQYVEKTDFKDKIGTLSQFGHEMEKLREAVPDGLKVVVFIDDLDRCNGKILGELIEALQLAEVSHTCIFVMAMDMEIVATAIEKERSELAQSTGNVARMEHGKGYKFLEKIIQARLTLPSHESERMQRLIKDAMPAAKKADGGDGGAAPPPNAPPPPEPPAEGDPTLMGRLREGLKRFVGGPREIPSDSDAVIETATHYGSRHFSNPRRLKRFINGFRLQTYVAAAAAQDSEARQKPPPSIEHLARFLVLAEKWPAVLAYMRDREFGSRELLEEKPAGAAPTMGDEIRRLRQEDRDSVEELLQGRDRRDPLTADEWETLAKAYGFGHYGAAESG